MKKAPVNGVEVSAYKYFVLNKLGMEMDGPICPKSGCHLHFYGRPAARMRYLGLNYTGLRMPRFDHAPDENPDCPLRKGEKAIEREMIDYEHELLSRMYGPAITLGKIEIAFILSAWTYMFGAQAATLRKFDEARAAASRDRLLNLRGLELWRVVYALTLPNQIAFEAPDGRLLKMVPREGIADEAEYDKMHGRVGDLYAVYADTRQVFSGPHRISKAYVHHHASLKSRKAAAGLFTPQLPLPPPASPRHVRGQNLA